MSWTNKQVNLRVTVPRHIGEELMKLNGLEFTGKNFVTEEARKKLSERCKLASITRLESVEQTKPGPSNTELIPPKRQSPFQKINKKMLLFSQTVW